MKLSLSNQGQRYCGYGFERTNTEALNPYSHSGEPQQKQDGEPSINNIAQNNTKVQEKDGVRFDELHSPNQMIEQWGSLKKGDKVVSYLVTSIGDLLRKPTTKADFGLPLPLMVEKLIIDSIKTLGESIKVLRRLIK
jgi:hypothetical protein